MRAGVGFALVCAGLFFFLLACECRAVVALAFCELFAFAGFAVLAEFKAVRWLFGALAVLSLVCVFCC